MQGAWDRAYHAEHCFGHASPLTLNLVRGPSVSQVWILLQNADRAFVTSYCSLLARYTGLWPPGVDYTQEGRQKSVNYLAVCKMGIPGQHLSYKVPVALAALWDALLKEAYILPALKVCNKTASAVYCQGCCLLWSRPMLYFHFSYVT